MSRQSKKISIIPEYKYQDEKVHSLAQLLSDDGWVDYSQYIDYKMNIADKVDYLAHDSVFRNKRKQIIKAKKDQEALQQIIDRQSGKSESKWNQIDELVSNAIDASVEGVEIGRFGIGFKQVLQELKHNARVVVLTRGRDQEHGRIIEFALNSKKEVYIRDHKITSSAMPEAGTRIIVTRSLNTAEKDEIRLSLTRKFQRCTSIQIQLNNQVINQFMGIVDLMGCPLALNSKIKVDVITTPYGYEVRDYGKGMPDKIVFEHFVMANLSTKKLVPGGEKLFYFPQTEKEDGKATPTKKSSTFELVLSGVTLESFEMDELDMPSLVIFHLPHASQLTSSRTEVQVEEKVLDGIEKMALTILQQPHRGTVIHSIAQAITQALPFFHHPDPNTTDIPALIGAYAFVDRQSLPLINAVISLLKKFVRTGRAIGAEHERIEVIRSKIRSHLLGILNPESIYLPRMAGCEYIDTAGGPVGFLDPTIYPEQEIERIPGIERIRTFESEHYKAYTLVLKTDYRTPIYLTFDRVLVFDRNIAEFYEDTPEALNLMLNYWIGYGDKPKLKGLFRKREAKDLVISGTDSAAFVEELPAEPVKASDLPLEEEKSEYKKNVSGESDEPKMAINKDNIEAEANALIEELLSGVELIEEEEKSESLTDSGGSLSSASYGKFKGVVAKEKTVEKLIKRYIKESVTANIDKDIIKMTVHDFIKRYKNLNMTSIKISGWDFEANSNFGISDKIYFLVGNVVYWCSQVEEYKIQIYANKCKLGPEFESIATSTFRFVEGNIWWVGCTVSGGYAVYRNGKFIAKYPDIYNNHDTGGTIFKIFKDSAYWEDNPDNSSNGWGIYCNGKLITKRGERIKNFYVTNQDIWWLTDTSHVYKNNILLASYESGSIGDFELSNGIAWWVVRNNNKAELYRNCILLAKFDGPYYQLEVIRDNYWLYGHGRVYKNGELIRDQLRRITNLQISNDQAWWWSYDLKDSKTKVFRDGKMISQVPNDTMFSCFQIANGEAWWIGSNEGEFGVYKNGTLLTKVRKNQIKKIYRRQSSFNGPDMPRFFLRVWDNQKWLIWNRHERKGSFYHGSKHLIDVEEIFIHRNGSILWVAIQNKKLVIYVDQIKIYEAINYSIGDFAVDEGFYMNFRDCTGHDSCSWWVSSQGKSVVYCPITLSQIGNPLTENEIKHINQFRISDIPQLKLNKGKISYHKNQYEHAILMHGSFGFSPDVFKALPTHVAIMTLSVWLQWYVEEKFITNAWIQKKLKKYPDKTPEWWLYYWEFYKTFLFAIPSAAVFQRLEEAWELCYEADEAVAQQLLKVSWKTNGERLKPALTPWQSPLMPQQKQTVLQTLKEIKDVQEKIEYCQCIINHGSYNLILKKNSSDSKAEKFQAIFSLPCVQLAIRFLGDDFLDFLEQEDITPEWLMTLSQLSLTFGQWQVFWKFIRATKNEFYVPKSFIAFTQRLMVICKTLKLEHINAETLRKQLEEEATLTIHPGRLEKIDEQQVGNFLTADLDKFETKQRAIYTSHFNEYFLCYGLSQFDPSLRSVLSIYLGMAVLGIGFAHYIEKSHMTSSWLAEKVEKFGNKSNSWWACYWEFFHLMEKHIPNAEMFKQLSSRWDLLCQMDDDLNGIQDSQTAWLLKQLKDKDWARYLVCQPDQPFPEELEGYMKFFSKKDVTVLDEEVLGLGKGSKSEFKTKEPIDKTDKPFSLAQLTLYSSRSRPENAQDTKAIVKMKALTLSQLKSGLAELDKPDFKTNINNHRQVIRGSILQQNGVRYVWLREAVQNARDAINKHLKIYFEKASQVIPQELKVVGLDSNGPHHPIPLILEYCEFPLTIDIGHYFYRQTNPTSQEDKHHFVRSVKDLVGMELWEIVYLLLSPHSSDPEKRALQLTGEFGIGFFTQFLDADLVEVRTGNGKKSYLISMHVKREKDQIEDIMVERCEEYNDDYKGTDVKSIKIYSPSQAILGHMEGLFLKNRIQLLVGGLVAESFVFKQGKPQKIPIVESRPALTYRGKNLPAI